MYNKMKKICLSLSLPLALALVVTATGCLGEAPVAEVTVVAENRLCDKLLYTEYSDGTAMLTGYDGTLTELILPDMVNGLALTAIAPRAFENSATLTTLRCGENMTNIGYECFYQCSALETVEIGAGVTDIGYYAFEGTPWMAAQTDEFVLAGDGVLLKYQGKGGAVTIPDTVKVLSDAFFRCDTLTEVTLGKNVEVVGPYAFAYCTSLRDVQFNASLRVIGDYAFAFCENLRSIKLPANVTEIGTSAFFYCTLLRRFEANEALLSIGADAFNYCNHLTSVSLGCDLREVGDYAFYECYILVGVTYDGTPDEWEQISMGQGNAMLTDAARNYLGN